MANPSKYHLPLAELSSHREEVAEEDEEVCSESTEDSFLFYQIAVVWVVAVVL